MFDNSGYPIPLEFNGIFTGVINFEKISVGLVNNNSIFFMEKVVGESGIILSKVESMEDIKFKITGDDY